ncbi:MAG TPA: GIY-YIG nuclease family protein [Cyclobacteriaceae bacterium]|nr:GIY-YIG nuclease family protein [Cyclobacteriaceae bacterium]
MFHVYILYSPSYDKIYVGFTSDLASRIKSHNELSKKGWTVKFRPWMLVHSEEFVTKADAMRREKELKSAKGRKFIWEQIISKLNLGS